MAKTKLTPSFVRKATCPTGQAKADYFDIEQRGFMLEVRRSGGKTFYQRYTDARGRERQFKIGPADILSVAQARRKGKEIVAEALVGSDPQQTRCELRAVPRLRDFVTERYLPFVKTYKRSWRTDETVLRIHVLPHIGALFLDEITADRIIHIVSAMRSDNYAPGTIGRVIVILRYLFNLASKWNVFNGDDNPAAGIPVPPDVQRNRFLNSDEIERLVEVLSKDENQVAAKAILLLLLTGARRNEVTHARWDHIDLEASTLFVPLSKSGKSRYVVLNADAVEVLKSVPQVPGNPYVFPSPVTGRPCASLHFPWHRIRTEANLTGVRLHDLRHTFASVLVNEGRDLYRVQRLLGHANVKATQRYAHLDQQSLADAAEAMSGVIGPFRKQAANSQPHTANDLPTIAAERDGRG